MYDDIYVLHTLTKNGCCESASQCSPLHIQLETMVAAPDIKLE